MAIKAVSIKPHRTKMFNNVKSEIAINYVRFFFIYYHSYPNSTGDAKFAENFKFYAKFIDFEGFWAFSNRVPFVCITHRNSQRIESNSQKVE